MKELITFAVAVISTYAAFKKKRESIVLLLIAYCAWGALFMMGIYK